MHLVLSCLQASDYPERKHNDRQAGINTDTSVPEIEIIYRGMKTKLETETEMPLGTETPPLSRMRAKSPRLYLGPASNVCVTLSRLLTLLSFEYVIRFMVLTATA